MHHTRKTCREDTTIDLMHMFLAHSDPFLEFPQERTLDGGSFGDTFLSASWMEESTENVSVSPPCPLLIDAATLQEYLDILGASPEAIFQFSVLGP